MTDNLAHHFLLDDGVVFLNHGSYGACPRSVFRAYQDWQLQLERQPVAFLDAKRGLKDWMLRARTMLATELGTSPDNIVGQMNATYALNVVAQSLALQPGDEILTTDHEYAALEKTWAYVCRKTGARIVVAPVALPLTSEPSFTQAITDAMTDRTKVLFLSHITSATALVFPIENVVAEARRRGIWSVIDGAHTPGHIKLNLDALDADFYAGNCHKWLMAPKGSAFLYVRPALQALINPLVISHGWQAGAQGVDPGPFGATAFIDSLEMQGTRDPAAWLTVPMAIEFRHAHDWDTVARQCRQMAQDTARRLATLTHLPPLSTAEFCAPQMVSMPIPDCDIDALKDRLMDHWHIEIPCFRWKDRCIVRLSVQGYTTQAQLDLLIRALTQELSLAPGLQSPLRNPVRAGKAGPALTE
ncbi:MAG: aminotransferase class V-fold PLP-dependent enzyme [bacterium]